MADAAERWRATAVAVAPLGRISGKERWTAAEELREASTRVETLKDGLRQCQNVLALLTQASPELQKVSSTHLWAQCVEAETNARRILKKLESE